MIGRFLEWLIVGKLAKRFPKRYRVIPRLDGKPMLRQFKITDWCYLQSFLIGETDGWFHRHRWRRMISIVLSGGFVEERYPGDWYKAHTAPSVYSMDYTTIHRLHSVALRTWTLFFMFRNQRLWGYFPRPADDGYVPWDEMITPGNRVDPL